MMEMVWKNKKKFQNVTNQLVWEGIKIAYSKFSKIDFSIDLSCGEIIWAPLPQYTL